jgi:hypothetical protein
MVEAIHIYKRDKDSTSKIISKYTQITDPVHIVIVAESGLLHGKQ